ncbi:M23 family metallopeptidase [Aeromicrobium sp. PE09-221]|uniref:M23 family metallopeptidase n=1 Tax=Aeromicrobium sp. PE09-221 TaxID=1898043 RepID=UPI001482B7F1|nr:M23 family metallopeptidase [Aeromicrobium sp. PE09-221]
MAAFAAPPAIADSKDDIRRQQGENEQRRSQARQDLQHSTARFQEASTALSAATSQLKNAQDVLGQTRGELVVAQSRDAELREELTRAEADLKAAEERVDVAAKELDDSESVVEQFAVDSVMEGDRGLRAFSGLLRGEAPTTFSERVQMNESIGDAQIATMQELDAARVMVELERQRVQELRDQVAAQKREAEANVVRMQELTTQAETQAAEVSQLVETREAAQTEANVAKAQDEKALAELDAERAALEGRMQAIVDEELRKERERRAREGGGGGGGGGGPAPGGGGGGGSVLGYPVNGPITSPYGMRRHPVTGVYKLHDGTDFGAGCGVPVRASASGTIVEQYYNSAYGNRVIINHGVIGGSNLMTTYNHMSGFAASPGQYVNRGDVIGYVGTTGLSTGCHMHLMVLQNGATTNPMSWL